MRKDWAEEGAQAESGASSLEELSHPSMRVKPQTLYDPVGVTFGGLVFVIFLPILMQAISQFLSGAGFGPSMGQSYGMRYPVQQLVGVMRG